MKTEIDRLNLLRIRLYSKTIIEVSKTSPKKTTPKVYYNSDRIGLGPGSTWGKKAREAGTRADHMTNFSPG